jgi:general nucleoside transport system ATP-binding protein
MLDATSHAGSSRSGPLLSAVSIGKRYGDFLANDGIDLDLFPAEILVKTRAAANCAGWGRKIVLAGPSAARDLGIGLVFQHFDLQMGDSISSFA